MKKNTKICQSMKLTDASFTSPATVSRAIRKCGFSGIARIEIIKSPVR